MGLPFYTKGRWVSAQDPFSLSFFLENNSLYFPQLASHSSFMSKSCRKLSKSHQSRPNSSFLGGGGGGNHYLTQGFILQLTTTSNSLTDYVTRAGLELTAIFLPQPPPDDGIDYRCELPCPLTFYHESQIHTGSPNKTQDHKTLGNDKRLLRMKCIRKLGCFMAALTCLCGSTQGHYRVHSEYTRLRYECY